MIVGQSKIQVLDFVGNRMLSGNSALFRHPIKPIGAPIDRLQLMARFEIGAGLCPRPFAVLLAEHQRPVPEVYVATGRALLAIANGEQLSELGRYRDTSLMEQSQGAPPVRVSSQGEMFKLGLGRTASPSLHTKAMVVITQHHEVVISDMSTGAITGLQVFANWSQAFEQ